MSVLNGEHFASAKDISALIYLLCNLHFYDLIKKYKSASESIDFFYATPNEAAFYIARLNK